MLITYEALAARGIVASKVTIWRWERAGKFPRRVTISHQKVGWVETEIDAWIAAKIAERRS